MTDRGEVDRFLERLFANRTSRLRSKVERQTAALRMLQEKRGVQFALDGGGEIIGDEIFFAGEWWVPKRYATRLAEVEKSHQERLRDVRAQIAVVEALRSAMPRRLLPAGADLVRFSRAVRELIAENDQLRSALKDYLDRSKP